MNIIADLMISLALIVLIALTFVLSMPLIYKMDEYNSEIALSIALNKLNNAIQFLYKKPLSALFLEIYLPGNTWIYINNNKIQFSAKFKLLLYDPNEIILEIKENEIIYNQNKIKFNNFIINKNINKVTIICISITEILIKETY